MNAERTVIDWLHAEAPHNAPPQLLARTLEKVAVLPQERVLWRRRPVSSRRDRSARPLLLVAATLLGLTFLGASLAFIGGRAVPPIPTPAEPTPSPIAQRFGLAYGLDGDIFVANWDGSNHVRIADGDPPDALVSTCGSFGAYRGLTSPDGRYIAYRDEWSDECPGVVYLANSTGELIASVPGIGWEVSWSPDSTRFVTWLSLWSDVVVYGVDGSRQAVIEGSAWCCGGVGP